MPETFDPAWEYYAPDPEIEIAMGRNVRLRPLDRVPTHGERDYLFGVRRRPGRGPRASPMRRRGDGRLDPREELFIRLWCEGATYGRIQVAMGWECRQTVRKWRDRLKCPPRMQGGYRDRSAAQVAHMRGQVA